MLTFWVEISPALVQHAEAYSLYRRTGSRWLGSYSFLWFEEEPEFFKLVPPKRRVMLFRVQRSERLRPLSYQYGDSELQVKAIKADTLHALGITGAGVKIGIFDTGFDLQNSALRGVKVAGQIDLNSGDWIAVEGKRLKSPSGHAFYVHSYDCEVWAGKTVCVHSGADEIKLSGTNVMRWDLHAVIHTGNPQEDDVFRVQIGYEYNPSLAVIRDSLYVVWTSGFNTVKLATLDTLNDTLNDPVVFTGIQIAKLDTVRDTLVLGVFTGSEFRLCYYNRATSSLPCWNSASAPYYGGMSLRGDTLTFSDGQRVFLMTRSSVSHVADGFSPVYKNGRLAYIRNDSVFVDGRFIKESPMITGIAFNGERVLVPDVDSILEFSHSGDFIRSLGWTRCDMPMYLGDRAVFRARGDTLAEVPEYGSGRYHGTRVLSVLAGFVPGRLVGVAPGATYYLAKTEKVSRRDTTTPWENRVEEDFLVAALEWAVRRGVDIVNVSLGYGGDLGYTKYAMDGRTAYSSRAFSRAMEEGVLAVISMGNVNPRPLPPQDVGDTTLSAPADAFSVISVSGVVFDTVGGRWIPSLESAFGPSADGRVKPELVAPFTVVAADDSFPLVSVSGTSYSAPLVVGALALALEVHPSWDAAKLRQKALETADQLEGFSTPNFITGYGMVNALRLATSEEFEKEVKRLRLSVRMVYPNPASRGRHKKVWVRVMSEVPSGYSEVRVYTPSGVPVKTLKLKDGIGVGYTDVEVPIEDLRPGLYFISVLTENGYASGKFVVER